LKGVLKIITWHKIEAIYMHVTSFKFYIAQYFLPTGLNAVSGERKCTYLGLQWIKGGCLRK
jgi:hypothetical protein